MPVRAAFHAIEDFLSLAPTPEDLLIGPFLPRGNIALLFGPPSAGKSMLLTTAVVALANGEPLFERFPCRKTRVVIVQADMNAIMCRKRLEAAKRPFSNACVLLTDGIPFDILNSREANAILAPACAFDPELVWVDTLRKTHNLDENDSGAADRVYGAWRTFFPNAAIIFNHHSRKIPAQFDNEDVVIREAFRGNTAWAAGADTLFMLRRTKHAEWTTSLTFVRTRACEEPEGLFLRKTPELLLVPARGASVAERKLAEWLRRHANATKTEAVRWLTQQRGDDGSSLCSEATAYRAYAKVAS